MAAIDHLRESHSIEFTDAGERIISTIYVPSGDLTGTVDQILHNAAGLAAVPSRGDAHPNISGLQCLSVRGQMDQSGGGVIFSIEWGEPAAVSDNALLDTTGVLEVFGTVQSETTNRDKDGALLVAVWNGTILDVFPDSTSGATPINWTERAEAEVSRPSTGYQLTARVANIGLIETYNDTYTGAVNSLTYSGKAPRTLLMMDIRGSNTNPQDIRCVFRMAYRPETWDQEIIARPYGRIPQNLDNPSGNGLTTVRHYAEVDFNGLPVSF